MNLTVKTYLQDHSIDLADILENEAKVATKKKKRGGIYYYTSLRERFIFWTAALDSICTY